MKKKITLILLALVCALCCAFGLAACGGEKPDDKTVAVENIALNKTTLTLEIDGTETLTVTVTPDNATDKAVTWSSSAPTIASVDNTGKVTAKAEGTAIITAKTANNKTATCAVTVNAPTPTDQVTAAQWKQIMSTTNNFELTISADGMETTMLIAGENRMQAFQDQKVIFSKDGTAYYNYMFDGTKWVRYTISADDYAESDLHAKVLTYFQDDFSAFTYADGKYTCAALDKTEQMDGVIENVVVKFENGALKELSFSNSDTTEEINFEIKNVGTTTITLPTNFTESNS